MYQSSCMYVDTDISEPVDSDEKFDNVVKINCATLVAETIENCW